MRRDTMKAAVQGWDFVVAYMSGCLGAYMLGLNVLMQQREPGGDDDWY